MPAESKAQQRFMAMVHQHQKGELDTSSVPADVMKRIRKAAGSMSQKDSKKMASTKHKDLPEKVSEAKKLTFKQYLIAEAASK